jgi:hypothetical protein
MPIALAAVCLYRINSSRSYLRLPGSFLNGVSCQIAWYIIGSLLGGNARLLLLAIPAVQGKSTLPDLLLWISVSNRIALPPAG